MNEADRRWMRRALQHARRGVGRTTPNPVVGACVVSSEGVVIGQGAHERAGEPHAEVHALIEAGEAARGATLYCTLEPCAHTGRTPPCTDRIIAAGITRVVAAMEDPHPLVQGRGFAALRAHGIEVEVGVERAAALRLNQPFVTTVREGRPFVILKAATSLDGRIAAARGARTALTSDAALRHAHGVRAWIDAVAVGSDTLLVDDPLLTARGIYRERPLTRVILDRRLRTPVSARVLSTLSAGPVIILTSQHALETKRRDAAALEQAGATLLSAPDTGIAAALRVLPRHDVYSLVIEGGAAVHAAAWDAGVVDYVQVYIAPVWLGAEGVPVWGGREVATSALIERRVDLLGPDVLIEGYVHRPD
ncbi:MAG TPA: bifunctional diaminohydroxyphosphoribosylaminopyrimidine deaminase/5-amino-6-(5-phosphoribosylamino)uracil reductase RibD [Vicinamibacterales bacterium]|nr:bifunctional diaminohydroxyphosphoribosylaminopyrimidine deaminase/5-amino-6-(5-phosphoribosylamino)uracil reductase RibD [Vicinamibacterales bacterium]